ncbi:MAG: flagellar hook-length control protein FliK [Sedimentisphaerales bacterium]|nr:flagellar hook-length control protein FliK [Sedimentisphaerales bacterium]
MQVKDLKNLSPNLEMFAAHKPVGQADADVFGSVFNVARHEAAETRSLSPSEIRQRAYDNERLDSFNTRQRRQIEPTDSRADNNSIENVTRSERCREHDALEPSHSRLKEEAAGPKGAAEKDDSVEVPVSSENNSSEQVLNDQMMNNPAEQSGVVPVRDSKGNIINANSVQSNDSETADGRKALLQIQTNKNAAQGLEKQHEANVSKQAASTESGKAVSDDLKLLLTENNESQRHQGDIENNGNAKGSAMGVDEFGTHAAKAQNAAHNLTTNENDKNVVEPLSLDALARSLQAEKNEAVRSGVTVEQLQNSSQSLVPVSTDNTNMSNGSFADRGNKNNNNPLEALTRGGMRVDSEKPANIQDTISPQKTTDVGTPDMQHNVDRIVKAARTIANRGSSVMQLRLDPPELGMVRVEVRHSADGLNLQLQATNHRTQQLLQQHSSELRSALEAQGFQGTRIEVQLRLDLRNDQQAFSQDQGGNYPQEHSREQQGRESQQNFQEQFQEMEFANLDIKA